MDRGHQDTIQERGNHRGRSSLVDQALALLQPTPGQPRDLSGAHQILASAGSSVEVQALRLRASLLATGTGCVANSKAALDLVRQCAQLGDERSRLELIMLSRMADHRVGATDRLSEQPLVELRHNVLSAAECGYLKTLAEPLFEPSVIIDPANGDRRPDPVRTSYGMSFGPLSEDIVIHAINHRIATVTGTDYSSGEPLHLLRYSGGQQYRPHCDALPSSGNLRIWTAIVYLNDDYEGGETEFPLLGLKIRGSTGDMLLFSNVDAKGEPEPLSRHAGLPVTDGTKYIATRWIRSRRYHAWD